MGGTGRLDRWDQTAAVEGTQGCARIRVRPHSCARAHAGGGEKAGLPDAVDSPGTNAK